MRQWEERGYGQGRKKKKSKDVKKAAAKKLGRLERVEKPWAPWQLRLSLAPAARGGDVVARLAGAVVERGGFRVGPGRPRASPRRPARAARPQRRGQDDAPEGAARRAAAARPASAGSDPEPCSASCRRARARSRARSALLDRFVAESGLAAGEARGLLATFALGADDVLRPGALALTRRAQPCRDRAPLCARRERARARRADEQPRPRGDRAARARARSYEGAAVLVSHDRRFLDAFGATQTLEL